MSNTTAATQFTQSFAPAPGWSDDEQRSRYIATCSCGKKIGDKYGYVGLNRALNAAAKHVERQH